MDKPFEASFDLNIENIILAGNDVEKLKLIEDLPQLLQSESQQTRSQIIPMVLEELPNSSCELQVVTSNVFKSFMEKQVPGNLLCAVLQGIESRDTIVANSWMDTLVAIIPALDESQLKNHILPLVNSKSQLSQPLLSRIAACKMLGKIAIHACLDATDVKRDIVPLLQSLCQDCHPEVRSVICTQFPFIAQGLGSGLMRGDLLACLVELGSDENVYVRSASVSAIVHIFPSTSLGVKKATLLPLIKQLFTKSLQNDDITAATIAKEIGNIVEGLQPALTKSDCLWFVNVYEKLSSKGFSGEDDQTKCYEMDVTCRQHAALNLPAMSAFVSVAEPTQMETLHMIFKNLATDPCVVVRSTVAGCIHKVIKIFDATSKIFKSDFVNLLQDDSEEVLIALVPHLGPTLELFQEFDTLSKQTTNAATLEIGRALLKCQCELSSGNNWRLLKLFLHQLEHLPNCMPSDFIHQHFTPIVLTCAVEGRARPVRVQAAQTLLIFLRYNGKEVQRQWLRKKLITRLGKSDSYYTRLIYIKLCGLAKDVFSDTYFKQYFYEHLLHLAADPVANVRLCVVHLLATLKQMLVLPEDHLLLKRFDDAIKRYTCDEKDRDVVDAFQTKVKEIVSLDVDIKYKKEQKRRRDEEHRINAKSAVPVMSTKVSTVIRPTKDQFTMLTVKEGVRRKIENLKPTNFVARQTVSNLCNQLSDMSILEQHFYIDAGVNLPTKLDTQLKISNLNGNITDDDKVNLRKLPNSDGSPKNVNKRYSSVLSETCLVKSEQKQHNRRSLNLSPKTTSRIPVSKVKSKPQEAAVLTTAKVSQLPIFVRRETCCDGHTFPASEVKVKQKTTSAIKSNFDAYYSVE